MSRLFDLSQDIYEGMPVYPGHCKTVTFQHATHEETAPRWTSGFSIQTWGFLLNDNGPTHVDSFSHLDPDPSAQTIDQMPLDLFFGPAICLDVSAVPEKTDVTAEHVEEALTQSGLELNRGDLCFFYTATYDKYAGTRRLSDQSFAGSVSRRPTGSSTRGSRLSGSTPRPPTTRPPRSIRST